MKTILLKQMLHTLEDMIDSGACSPDEIDTDELIDVLGKFINHGVFLSKYEACRELGIERSRFDDLVRDGKIPRGTPKPGAKELFWKKQDIVSTKKEMKK